MLDSSLEDTRPYLFSLLGIVEGADPLAQMDGQIRKRRTLEAIKRILLRESLNQPLMVIFEDLHWIDEATQEFLNLLADSLGTAKLLLLVNYRPEYSHKWNSKTYYTQLRLDPLGKESAEEMLSALLTSPAPAALAVGADRERARPERAASTARGEAEGSAADLQVGGRVRVQDDIEALKRLIIERTEGTPFFMEEIVQSLFEDGVLQRNGVVKLAKSMNAVKVPATVQGVLAARIDRLPAEDKELLQTLAVLGREFPLGLVKQVTLRSDYELERGLSRLQAGEFIYERLAAGDVEYIFKHALTQEVAHNALLVERRKQLHERAGAALESMFAGQLEDHLDELAHHYSRSDNHAKAIEYLGRAGQHAAQHSANTEAIKHFNVALALLLTLPDTPERTEQELAIQVALGPPLQASKGWAAPEVERAYTRARELSERLGDPSDLFSALFGLRTVNLFRGELRKAHQLSERLLQLAQGQHEPELFLYAHSALGNTFHWMGEFAHARENLEIAISFYDPERHKPLTFRYFGVDAKASCLSYAAFTLWHLGYPDQALKKVNEAVAVAQKLSHPFSLSWTGYYVGVVRQLRREAHAAQGTAEIEITRAAEYGFIQFLAAATILRGWALAAQGHREQGIAQIREGLAASRAEPYRPHHLCLLAEACTEIGRLDEALAALAGALESADEHEIRHYEAETHRLKGELLLRKHDSNAAEAQRCFERAIEIARRQSAKSWELRATTSLARLLASQDRRDEARTMLADVYNWFTEGFDTADLKDAKALLDRLGSEP